MYFSASNVSFFQSISLYVMRNSLAVIFHLFSSSVQRPEKKCEFKKLKERIFVKDKTATPKILRCKNGNINNSACI